MKTFWRWLALTITTTLSTAFFQFRRARRQGLSIERSLAHAYDKAFDNGWDCAWYVGMFALLQHFDP